MEDFLWELKTERFLNGELTSEELLAFEQEQATKPELKEYVTLSVQLKQALSEEDWYTHKNTSEQYTTVKKWYQEDDVLAFKEKIQQQATKEFTTKEKTFSLSKYWIPIAAACLLLLITLVFQLTAQPTMKQLYPEYATWNDTPSFIVLDQNTRNTKEQIELLYTNEKYQECIAVADKFLNTSTTDRTNVMIYKGFSLVKLNQYTAALVVFKTISESDAIDASKGLWYMALVYLKIEDKENLQKTLQTITASDTNYKYEKALELMNAIQ
ncbi:tetratricopeptide repeat protein [Kordia sp.]|uniref:tetratricopeptide repeat protein n=1 Tax=Kordia sp. TaxID=1965332 RepID=UPI003D2C6C86